MPERYKTPSEVTRSMIQAAMAIDGRTSESLAEEMGVHVNTVYSDLKDPDKIPQGRLWLYFAVLGIPIQEALDGVANAFAYKLSRR